MSGELVGLVREHGPEDHNAWAVLTVIAEDLHGPMRSCVLTNADLGRDARLSRTAVKRAVAFLVDDGWVARTPGARTGVASTYRLRLERFPAEAVEKVLERGPHRTPVPESLNPQGSSQDPRRADRGPHRTQVGSSQDPPSVSVTTPSIPRATDEHLPGVLTGVRTGPDEAIVRTALDTFRVTPSRTLADEIGKALDRGHTASGINAHLLANVDVRGCRDLVAVLVKNVRDMPAVVAAVRPTCARCDGSRWVTVGDLANADQVPEADHETPARCPDCNGGRDDARPRPVRKMATGPLEERRRPVAPQAPSRSREDLLAAQRDRSRAASAGMRRRA